MYIKNWIKQVNSARNKVVHYKAFGKNNKEFINNKFTDTIRLALDGVINKIEILSKFIEKSKFQTLIGLDEAKEIAKKYLVSMQTESFFHKLLKEEVFGGELPLAIITTLSSQILRRSRRFFVFDLFRSTEIISG